MNALAVRLKNCYIQSRFKLIILSDKMTEGSWDGDWLILTPTGVKNDVIKSIEIVKSLDGYSNLTQVGGEWD